MFVAEKCSAVLKMNILRDPIQWKMCHLTVQLIISAIVGWVGGAKIITEQTTCILHNFVLQSPEHAPEKGAVAMETQAQAEELTTPKSKQPPPKPAPLVLPEGEGMGKEEEKEKVEGAEGEEIEGGGGEEKPVKSLEEMEPKQEQVEPASESW